MIVIVENINIVEYGLRAMLAAEFASEEIAVCRSVAELHLLKPTDGPMLMLVGLMNDTGGKSAQNIATAKAMFTGSPVVAYGTEQVPDVIRYYYAAGASGYFSLAGNESADCIRTVMEGKTYFNGAMIDSFIFHLQSRNRNFLGPVLTSRQRQVAYLLAKGIRPAAIAESVGIKAPTVAIIRGKIFKKLGIKSVSELQARMNFHPYPSHAPV